MRTSLSIFTVSVILQCLLSSSIVSALPTSLFPSFNHNTFQNVMTLLQPQPVVHQPPYSTTPIPAKVVTTHTTTPIPAKVVTTHTTTPIPAKVVTTHTTTPAPTPNALTSPAPQPDSETTTSSTSTSTSTLSSLINSASASSSSALSNNLIEATTADPNPGSLGLLYVFSEASKRLPIHELPMHMDYMGQSMSSWAGDTVKGIGTQATSFGDTLVDYLQSAAGEALKRSGELLTSSISSLERTVKEYLSDWIGCRPPKG